MTEQLQELWLEPVYNRETRELTLRDQHGVAHVSLSRDMVLKMFQTVDWSDDQI